MDSPPADQEVQTVIELELRLLQPQVRAEPGEVEMLLHPDFSEFGASGRHWGRSEVIAALAAEEPVAEEPAAEEPAAEEPAAEEPAAEEPVATDIAGTRLADGVIHLTYVSQRAGRRALRSSIWLRTPAGWRVYFHQGTLVRG